MNRIIHYRATFDMSFYVFIYENDEKSGLDYARARRVKFIELLL